MLPLWQFRQWKTFTNINKCNLVAQKGMFQWSVKENIVCFFVYVTKKGVCFKRVMVVCTLMRKSVVQVQLLHIDVHNFDFFYPVMFNCVIIEIVCHTYTPSMLTHRTPPTKHFWERNQPSKFTLVRALENAPHRMIILLWCHDQFVVWLAGAVSKVVWPIWEKVHFFCAEP